MQSWTYEEWMGQAICLGIDPDLWFPPRGGSTREAKMICNGNPRRAIPACPVREQCLAHALKNSEAFGVWGGKSEKERKRIKRTAG